MLTYASFFSVKKEKNPNSEKNLFLIQRLMLNLVSEMYDLIFTGERYIE